MESLGSFFVAILALFDTEFTVYGFSMSFWQIFLFTCVAAIIAYIIGGFFGD